MAGGTGLYLRALLHGLFEGRRGTSRCARAWKRSPTAAATRVLHRMLARVDPESAARIEPRDRVRVVRALEVFRATGRPIGEHHRAPARPLAGFDWRVVGLDPPRDALRAAVEARTRRDDRAPASSRRCAGCSRGYAADLRPLARDRLSPGRRASCAAELDVAAGAA